MVTAIVAILIFALLVIVHEFGHFIVAKWSGMYVDEFSVGFGPKVVGKKWGETNYNLRAIPLGGYVRIIGDDVAEEERAGIEVPELPEERKYHNIPIWKRFIFIAAGSFMNFVTAIVIFAGMFMVLGLAVPVENPDTTISAVVEGGPAEQAGVAPGDKIIEVNGVQVVTWNDLTEQITAVKQGEKVNLVILTPEGEEKALPEITPDYDEEAGRMLLGIYSSGVERQEVGILQSIQLGAMNTWDMTVAMGDVLKQLFTGKIDISDEEEGLTGPIGIVKIIDESTKAGWVYVCNLTALLSINLAIMNILPIPSLDGSKLLFLLIEAVRGGKRVDPAKENMVHFIGYMLLMLLVIYITYQDILRFFV
ncbi:MAG: RIP metalloprotease RseP [Peptococcaceae bacterium]|nr:RIP metalloprotease RseP [Peptococcaceae bacterium]